MASRAEGPNDFGSAVHGIILPVSAAPEVRVQAHARVVFSFGNATGQAGLELRYATDLPPSQNLPGQFRAVFEEWQVVEIVENQDVADGECRRPPQPAFHTSGDVNVRLIGAVVHRL